MKSLIIKPFAQAIARKIRRDAATAVDSQNQIFKQLISRAQATSFGKDHGFENIKTYSDFRKQVPIRNYESLRNYIDQVVAGKEDILWPGKPKYFAKTSGTTSGIKYIPITAKSIKYHINAARNATLNYTALKNDASIFEGKMIFLSGSPTLTNKNGIATGRLSGIVNHEIPYWIKKNQAPTYQTNCIEDWETKLDKIVEETKDQNLSVISGIPPWVQMYFERLIEVTGKSCIKDIFPNFNLFAYGGVNYEPYRNTLDKLIGEPVDTLETYPASEGFIAFQDQLKANGLLLNSNAGMFYEFVPLDEIQTDNPNRLTLADVQVDKDYVILINSNAGLWGYNLGDTVRFTSKDPYRLIVSGRVKHFISAFGEHVIAKEVETAIKEVSAQYNLAINEFTVAPQVNPQNGDTPYHEWFIEFEKVPSDVTKLAAKLDLVMIAQNIYYKDLIEGKILQPLKIRSLEKGAFSAYMKSLGKLGGQNKVPRLSNDRKIVDELNRYKIKSNGLEI